MLLSRCSFEGKFLKRVLSSILPDPRSEYVLSNFHPRSVHTEGKPLAILSYHVDEVLIDLLMISDGIRSMLQTEWVVLWFSESSFTSEFSNLSGVLGRFADSKSIPKNQPTTFHRDWNSTAEVPSLTLRTDRAAMPHDSERCFFFQQKNDMSQNCTHSQEEKFTRCYV